MGIDSSIMMAIFLAALMVSAVAGKTHHRHFSTQERQLVKDLFMIDNDLLNLERPDAEETKDAKKAPADVAGAAVALGGASQAFCSASMTPCGDNDADGGKCSAADNHVSSLEKTQWCVGFCLKKDDLDKMVANGDAQSKEFKACTEKIGKDGIAGCCFSGVYNHEAPSLDEAYEGSTVRYPNDSMHPG